MDVRQSALNGARTATQFIELAGSLRKKLIRKHIYKTREIAWADVFDYIEVFCHAATVI